MTAQIDAGIDIPTDGEMRREHYIFYHLRHLNGVDFEHLQLREIRTRAWEREVPTIIADTVADEHYDDPRELNRDLADALNVEIRVLVPAGRRPYPSGRTGIRAQDR